MGEYAPIIPEVGLFIVVSFMRIKQGKSRFSCGKKLLAIDV